MDFEQLTTRVRNLNLARMELEGLHIWWQSLSMVEKRLPANKEYLVKITEEHTNAEISALIKGSTRLGKPHEEEDDGNDNNLKRM